VDTHLVRTHAHNHTYLARPGGVRVCAPNFFHPREFLAIFAVRSPAVRHADAPGAARSLSSGSLADFPVRPTLMTGIIIPPRLICVRGDKEAGRER